MRTRRAKGTGEKDPAKIPIKTSEAFKSQYDIHFSPTEQKLVTDDYVALPAIPTGHSPSDVKSEADVESDAGLERMAKVPDGEANDNLKECIANSKSVLLEQKLTAEIEVAKAVTDDRSRNEFKDREEVQGQNTVVEVYSLVDKGGVIWSADISSVTAPHEDSKQINYTETAHIANNGAVDQGKEEIVENILGMDPAIKKKQSVKDDEIMDEVQEVQDTQRDKVEVGRPIEGAELDVDKCGDGSNGKIGDKDAEGGGEEHCDDGIGKDVDREAAIGYEYLDIQQTMPVSERQKEKRLEVFVGGLDKEATEEDLKEVFKQVGEITEVRLIINPQTGKNRGYAFVRYATMEQAKHAAAELDRVQIRGKPCGVRKSEDNDTLFVGNINRAWKKETVMEKLTGYSIENVEELILMEDPQTKGSNRGFAFLEFTTHRDALKGFKRLQLPDAIFGADRSAEVAWAQPLNEPDEETMTQVKSVFMDGLPSTWDEGHVKDHFGKYGEIEQVILARNMPAALRKDFGFVEYTTHEAALACIEAVHNTELTDDDKKMKLKVTLSKSVDKRKPFKGDVRGGHLVQHSGMQPTGGRGSGRTRTGSGRGHTRRGSRSNKFLGVSSNRRFAGVSSRHLPLQAQREHALHEERARLARYTSGGGGTFSQGYTGGIDYSGAVRAREAFPAYSFFGVHGNPSGQCLDQGPVQHFVGSYNQPLAAAGSYFAAPGVKRAYSALGLDPRHTDAVSGHPRARVEHAVSMGQGASQLPAVPSHGYFVRPPGLHATQYDGRGGGLHSSGSQTPNTIYPGEYLATGEGLRGEPLHPSSFHGTLSGPGGYPLPGAAAGSLY